MFITKAGTGFYKVGTKGFVEHLISQNYTAVKTKIVLTSWMTSKIKEGDVRSQKLSVYWPPESHLKPELELL